MFFSKKSKLIAIKKEEYVRVKYRGMSRDLIGDIFPIIMKTLAVECKENAKPGVDWKQAFERITEMAKAVALAEVGADTHED